MPTSAYPKPSAPHTSRPVPSLSKPAARPIGPGNSHAEHGAGQGGIASAPVVGAARGGPGPSRSAAAAPRTPRCESARRAPGTSPAAARGSSLQPRLVAWSFSLSAPQQNSSATVVVEPNPGQLPTAVLGLDRQPRRRRQPRHVWRQSQRHPLVVVGKSTSHPLGKPAAGHRHRGLPALGITCTPSPLADTTYRVSVASSNGQHVRLSHGGVTHLLHRYSSCQIVTNDGVRRRQ